jgi:hypothetical protein
VYSRIEEDFFLKWTPLPSVPDAEFIQAVQDLSIATRKDNCLPTWRLLRNPAPPAKPDDMLSRIMDDSKYIWNQVCICSRRHLMNGSDGCGLISSMPQSGIIPPK